MVNASLTLVVYLTIWGRSISCVSATPENGARALPGSTSRRKAKGCPPTKLFLSFRHISGTRLRPFAQLFTQYLLGKYLEEMNVGEDEVDECCKHY
jgi:hypothetical protein